MTIWGKFDDSKLLEFLYLWMFQIFKSHGFCVLELMKALFLKNVREYSNSSCLNKKTQYFLPKFQKMMAEGCLSWVFCLFPSALDCVHMWCVRKMKHYPTFHPCQVCMRVYTINILYLPLPQHTMLHFVENIVYRWLNLGTFFTSAQMSQKYEKTLRYSG